VRGGGFPHDLPAWGTVYWYFRRWRDEGVWEQVLRVLRLEVRTQQGRQPEPTAAIMDTDVYNLSRAEIPVHFLFFDQA
jgi:transposase